MTNKEKLKWEALMWALDNDTVNHLVEYAHNELGIEEHDVILLVQELCRLKYVRVYLETIQGHRIRDLGFREITSDLLAANTYVSMTKTEQTIQQIEALDNTLH